MPSISVKTVTQPAFVMPVYDIRDDEYLPCERGDAVGYQVVVWCTEGQEWYTLPDFFEDYSAALSLAKIKAGAVLADYRARP